jgi:nicotinamidase-related amidase
MRNLSNLDWSKCALVVVDLQKGYCDPASDAAQRLGWDVAAAEEVCRAHVGFLNEVRKLLPPKQIIWFQMEEAAHSMAPNMHYGPERGDDVFVPLCVRGTAGHDFHIVSPAPDEPVFQKFHNSGFSNPEFRQHLADNKLTQLVTTGVVTSRCVNSTIVAASALGFENAVITGLVAGPAKLKTEMDEHLKVTTFFFAMPLTPEAFLDRLRQSLNGPAFNHA